MNRRITTIICYCASGCLVILLVALLILFCTPLGAYVAIGYEDVFTKWEINNPYVDRNLSGWQKIQIDGLSSFSIPKGWAMDFSNGVYSIIEPSGNVWAIGTIFGTDTDFFDNYSDFFATHISTESFEISTDLCSEFIAMKGADIDKITICAPSGSTSYYCIQLDEASGPSLLLVLFSDISRNADHFNIAEAIMYSFAY